MKDFFRRFYAPNNASLSIAGDIDVDETKELVEKYFGDLHAGAAGRPRRSAGRRRSTSEVRLQLEDRVQLAAHLLRLGRRRRASTPTRRRWTCSSRSSARAAARACYRSLVYEKQIARDVSAYFAAMEIAGELRIDATVVPGAKRRGRRAGDLRGDRAHRRTSRRRDEEVQRAINRLEAHYVRQLESVGGFGGRADLLNYFNVFTGDPGRLNRTSTATSR